MNDNPKGRPNIGRYDISDVQLPFDADDAMDRGEYGVISGPALKKHKQDKSFIDEDNPQDDFGDSSDPLLRASKAKIKEKLHTFLDQANAQGLDCLKDDKALKIIEAWFAKTCYGYSNSNWHLLETRMKYLHELFSKITVDMLAGVNVSQGGWMKIEMKFSPLSDPIISELAKFDAVMWGLRAQKPVDIHFFFKTQMEPRLFALERQRDARQEMCLLDSVRGQNDTIANIETRLEKKIESAVSDGVTEIKNMIAGMNIGGAGGASGY